MKIVVKYGLGMRGARIDTRWKSRANIAVLYWIRENTIEFARTSRKDKSLVLVGGLERESYNCRYKLHDSNRTQKF